MNSPSAPSSATLSLDGLRIVVDCANGAAFRSPRKPCGNWAPKSFRLALSRTVSTSTGVLGLPRQAPLSIKSREVRADIGIALDGDADRVIIVDETGKLVDGDQLMAAIAQSWKEDGRLSRPGIVATVMSNLGLERYLEGLGLSLARTAVGDRYVLEHMREQGVNLGGEQSGHIILLDHCTTGDGLVAALQLLAIVKREDKPVSQLCRRFEPVPQEDLEKCAVQGRAAVGGREHYPCH